MEAGPRDTPQPRRDLTTTRPENTAAVKIPGGDSVWPLSRLLLVPGQCHHDRDPEARGEPPPAAAQEAGPGHQAQRGKHHHQGEVYHVST